MWVQLVIQQVPLPVRHDGRLAYLHMHQGEETALESRAHGFSHVIANDFLHFFWKKRNGVLILYE